MELDSIIVPDLLVLGSESISGDDFSNSGLQLSISEH
jgi:hypothetical protein